MKDKLFIDTNVLVYTYSNSEPAKQSIARKLVEKNDAYISTQVLQELVNTITRKLNYSFTNALMVVNECSRNNLIHINTNSTIIKACNIAQEYKFSFYDSLIVAAAIECNCSFLYTEDMHNGLIIDGSLTIINPFI